jgi:prepilin-type N-terminal cleavage/methylation domain-containing protein/prepilin-type processing-associated H-X9-DG protein
MTIRSLKVKRARRGFTLVEVMVVMTIIAILISILVPAVGYVRETARGSQCRASLRQFFVGFTGIADKTRDGKLSSGAWDGRRDGCMDTIGWVADLVNAKVCKPQELLCPTNPSRGTEKYNDLIGTSTSPASDGGPTNLVSGVGYCKTKAPGTWTGRDVGNNLLTKGYGTNHMTTWFMSRTAPKVSASGGILSYTGSASNRIKGLSGSLGALTRRILDTSPVSANTVPLMGDSNLGDIADRPAEQTIDDEQGIVFIQQGETLVESFSDGPADRATASSWQQSSVGTVTIFDPTNPLLHVSGQEQPPPGTAPAWNNRADHLQDYRDFGPVHSGSGNVLFADGSVKTFNDQNGDSFLNPGFEGGGSDVGYTDNLVELPAAEIFSGILLQRFYHPKQTLDPN